MVFLFAFLVVIKQYLVIRATFDFSNALRMTGEGLQRYARKLPMFLSRLNEISGGFEKILPVSLLFWSNLKFFKM